VSAGERKGAGSGTAPGTESGTGPERGRDARAGEGPVVGPVVGKEQPDALELLAVARETLLDAVLPELRGAARYQALMIANAMAIAQREIAGGGDAGASERQMLDTLYGDAEPRVDAEDDAARLARLTRRLARDLRNGELDGGPQLGVRRLLRERLEARLAVSNPKRLAKTPG